MNPDVAAAVSKLEAEGVLGATTAAHLGRIARGELVSVRTELRLVLYLGVTLFVSGLGLFLKDSTFGPQTIVFALAVASLACFVFVSRRAAPFSWGKTPESHLALDYILLLGVLILGADLAYWESHFALLGDSWPWHLLTVSLVALLLSVRYDSAVVFGLALSSFAAWRGVATSLHSAEWIFSDPGDSIRANALACGVLFALIGEALPPMDRKPHFGPVADTLGYALILGGLMSGLGRGQAYAVALCGAGALLAMLSFHRRRFWHFAMGSLAGYVGLSTLLIWGSDGGVVFLWFLVTPPVALVLLIVADRAMKRKR